MADRISTRETVREEINRYSENYTSGYLRRLIGDRALIRAALYNHGGSIITHGISLDLEGQDVYSSQIGNDYHLDLVEAERIILTELNGQQRQALLEWAGGISEEQSADLKRIRPSSLRKRRQRAVEKLTSGMGDNPDG